MSRSILIRTALVATSLAAVLPSALARAAWSEA
jgi:hypothetical protein